MINKYFSKIINLSQEPVFIVGFPRSGTTLLQSLLITQENLISFPETHFFLSIYPLVSINDIGVINSQIAENVYNVVNEKINIKFSNNEKQIISDRISKNKLFIKDFFEIIIIKCILKYCGNINQTKIKWVEKTPYHTMFIDKIFRYYPLAKVIHIVRDPIKVILSWKKSLTHLDDLSYEELANNWIKYILIFERFNKKYGDRIITVKYENIVEETDKSLEFIFKFLEMNFEKDKLSDFSKESKGIIHNWEVWKNNNFNKEIKNMNNLYKQSDKEITETFQAKQILKDKTAEYGYCY